MTSEQFFHSIREPNPPVGLSVQLQALWYEAKGDWHTAHSLIDQLDDGISAHIHAYLHRVEGDLWNARYWYNRAGQPEFKGSLVAERDALISRYL